MDLENCMWNQRSKTEWLRNGNQNMKYFHSKASKRKKKNTILGLEDEEGNWCNTKEGIADIVVPYFQKLYTTSYPS